MQPREALFLFTTRGRFMAVENTSPRSEPQPLLI